MPAFVRGLARRSRRKEPMEEVHTSFISTEAGLAGDFKGSKHKTRQITILALEDWHSALKDLHLSPDNLAWTTRRANILSEGIRLPRAKGAILAIGSIRLEITGQTYPCRRMDEAQPGLLKSLAQNWRGGVTCTVTASGPIALGDEIKIISSPPEAPARKLPG